MGELRSIDVYVVGQARRPGRYTVSSLSTLANAVFASGGPSTTGSMRHIELKRGTNVVTDFDLYDLLLKGDKSKDVLLLPEDVIYIAPIGPQVAMGGQVNVPPSMNSRPRPAWAMCCNWRVVFRRPPTERRSTSRQIKNRERPQHRRSQAGHRGPGPSAEGWRHPELHLDLAALREFGDLARQCGDSGPLSLARGHAGHRPDSQSRLSDHRANTGSSRTPSTCKRRPAAAGSAAN